MPVVKYNDNEIHYSVVGQGKPIVLLHGIFDSGETWINSNFPEELIGFQLILIDLRGHGKSKKYYNSSLYNLKFQATDVKMVLKELNLDRAIIWGYSYGGRIAFAFAICFPECVESLIVGGMHPYPVINVYSAINRRMNLVLYGMQNYLKHLESKNIELDPLQREILLANESKALYQIDRSILSWKGFGDTLAILQDVPFDIILYVGEDDRSYINLIREFKADFPHITLIIFPKMDHFGSYLESKRICQVIINNLSIDANKNSLTKS